LNVTLGDPAPAAANSVPQAWVRLEEGRRCACDHIPREAIAPCGESGQREISYTGIGHYIIPDRIVPRFPEILVDVGDDENTVVLVAVDAIVLHQIVVAAGQHDAIPPSRVLNAKERSFFLPHI
jgi:hypothetical protein